MNTVRHSRTGIDDTKALADLAKAPQWTEAQVDAMAAADGDAWTDIDLSKAITVFPVQSPEQVRALRVRLGLSQAQFALQVGLTIDTVQQYEQGRRKPSGPASTLLRVIEAEPEAVVRALRGR